MLIKIRRTRSGKPVKYINLIKPGIQLYSKRGNIVITMKQVIT
jgi:hypothetical protein